MPELQIGALARRHWARVLVFSLFTAVREHNDECIVFHRLMLRLLSVSVAVACKKQPTRSLSSAGSGSSLQSDLRSSFADAAKLAPALLLILTGLSGVAYTAKLIEGIEAKFKMVDEKFRTTDEKFKTTDEKIGKVQATTDEKIGKAKAESELTSTQNYLKYAKSEEYNALRPETTGTARAVKEDA